MFEGAATFEALTFDARVTAVGTTAGGSTFIPGKFGATVTAVGAFRFIFTVAAVGDSYIGT